ncbi:MAG: hypothetical protein IKM21_01780 [Oscillospiraceae bacterium]|nr:hypothetical protein [Oscillospiraceae bacterium]
MSFWLTPVGLILPIVIYVLPVIIYRFFIKKEDIEHKKAKWFSIIYCIACFVLIGIISNEDAFFQAFAFVPIGFFNYFLLAGKKISRRVRILLKFHASRYAIGIISILCFLPLRGLISDSGVISSIVVIIVCIPFYIFYFLRSKEIERDVDSDIKWQEKLERERLEREQKEKDGR